MEIRKFSRKQGELLRFINEPGDAIICDGAVRSGKTLVMTLAFVLWAMEHFQDTNFAICGKTVQGAERNILKPFQQLEGLPYNMVYRVSTRCLTVTAGRKKNNFYFFGGKDESSYMLIQGLTLAGVLFDEVALMPRSFVDQAVARTLSYKNAKLWFNCNPESPNHWFYKDWLTNPDRPKKHLHFLMSDNPIMGGEEIARAESSFSGVFYDRYILGLRVRAEGLIYRVFAEHKKQFIVNREKLFEISKELQFITIGVDFGGNRSLTTFVASGFTRAYNKLAVLLDHHIKGAKGEIDPDRLNREFLEFVRQLRTLCPNIPIRFVFADSEAQYLINGLRKASRAAGMPFEVADSAKRPITQRIACTLALMAQKRLLISEDCTLVIGGLEGAVWDSDEAEKGKDVRLDDFSSDIDILDAYEYSFERFMNKLLPEIVR